MSQRRPLGHRLPPESTSGQPPYEILYERCQELGVVGIEFRRPTRDELYQLLEHRSAFG